MSSLSFSELLSPKEIPLVHKKAVQDRSNPIGDRPRLVLANFRTEDDALFAQSKQSLWRFARRPRRV